MATNSGTFVVKGRVYRRQPVIGESRDVGRIRVLYWRIAVPESAVIPNDGERRYAIAIPLAQRAVVSDAGVYRAWRNRRLVARRHAATTNSSLFNSFAA